MKRFALALLGAVMFAGTALAGPQYVDKTGYALSGYDVISIWNLETKQAPIGKPQPAGLPGKAAITAEYNGAKWAFATEANRDKFKADPAKYVPVYQGHCAYGAAQGAKVPANPHLWRIVDGKLYLNINKAVVGYWEKDIPGFVKKADIKWSTKLEAKAASKKPVPSFKTDQAPI